jgi:drug/metabolite transporter (DMT)-like permease
MDTPGSRTASPLLVVVAFAIVYVVWGSTYFFVQVALEGFPPFLLGALRFFAAAALMLVWSLFRRENLFSVRQIKPAVIVGLLLLFIGNGAVIWVEQYLPSAFVAITVSSSPIWFVLLDTPKWRENFSSRSTLVGLATGFAGVMLLFYEKIRLSLTSHEGYGDIGGMAIVILGAISWSAGSLYSKYRSTGSATVNSTWQMFSAGVAFLVCAGLRGEFSGFAWEQVPANAWAAVAYLIVFGSIAGFSAYVWLLSVRPATQVSTYAYVNPVVAVLLGTFFADETISLTQIAGLVVILGSVLLINLARYRKKGN